MIFRHVSVRFLFLVGLLLGQLESAGLAAAQNVLAIQGTSASPGTTGVAIPVNLTVGQNLTLLRFDVTFPSALCAAIADRNGDGVISGVVVGTDANVATGKDIVIRTTARVSKAAEEQPFLCSDGEVAVAVFDLSGSPVITSGSGGIFTIELDVKSGVPGGTFAFGLVNIQARQGPATVSITSQAGDFVVGTQPECITPTDCNDSNLCTQDLCVSGTCQHPAVVCNDGISCTIDSCDPAKGCQVVPDNSVCGDANSCTLDICQIGVGCTHPTVPAACGNGCPDAGETCDDGNTTNNDGCSATCQTERCGDGVKQTSEQCDDGNTTSGDGCSATCTLEPKCGNGSIEAGEQCDDSNTANNDGCSATCRTERCGDGIKQTNEQCDDSNTSSGDGCSATCTLEPKCGNGTIEAGETCDDGNTANNDGCSATCQAERCGDGIKQASEQCDDGNTTSGDGCSATCTTEARCGNGTVEAGEQCDDGNVASNDGCSATCQTERCGDGIKQTAEQCDDGNTINDDACTNACTTPRCGDSIKQASEQCDDGNSNSGDGCSATCTLEAKCGNGTVETGETCDDGNTASNDGCSTICQIERCGDGIKQTSEQCDDGNTTSNDGCSATCTLEAKCGNGAVDTGEQCDDGNTASNDGCSATCQTERCGDGIKQTSEQCDDGNIANGDGCSALCKTEPPPSDRVFLESAGQPGQFVIQAESFSVRTPSGTTAWIRVPEENPGFPSQFANFLGTGYIQALPDAAVAQTPLQLPSVEYKVCVKTPGTYRLYVRWDAFDDNSDTFYARIAELNDGPGGTIADWYRYVRIQDTLNFATLPWSGLGGAERSDSPFSDGETPVTWNIPNPGVYTVKFDMREDGAAIDAFVLQLVGLTAPTGNGPAVTLVGDASSCGLASITISKFASPATGQDFSFTGDLGNFTLDDAEPDDTDTVANSKTFTPLPAGDYTVTELLPPGWKLDDVICTGGASDSRPDGAVIHLKLGEHIVCSFTNARVCDVDGDGNIDRDDINAIFAARNTPASPGDVRDADGDGTITVGDSRTCVLQCSKPQCAP
jgi:cysteine-rich repeat protein